MAPIVIPESPQPPTTAYTVVALRLPSGHFDSIPPLRGLELCVECGDGSVSRWDLPTDLAGRIITALATDPTVVSTVATVFERCDPVGYERRA